MVKYDRFGGTEVPYTLGNPAGKTSQEHQVMICVYFNIEAFIERQIE